ncbi:hypothetical protein SynNOUM97013_01813 [Synechococcus sp. NOUM97013]|nr:hypothetical protein SynNOUM97013_01813 [Synechococcus sp. NOUM97013]
MEPSTNVIMDGLSAVFGVQRSFLPSLETFFAGHQRSDRCGRLVVV